MSPYIASRSSFRVTVDGSYVDVATNLDASVPTFVTFGRHGRSAQQQRRASCKTCFSYGPAGKRDTYLALTHKD